MSYKFMSIAVLLTLLSIGYGYADTADDNSFGSTLDVPSLAIAPANLSRLTFNAVAVSEQRIVAVGWRGLIIYSDDLGKSWTQAEVPVQVDLTAVSFDAHGTGWAAGHDQVILQSQDRGATWQKLFDNRKARELARTHYAPHADDYYRKLEEQALMNTEESWSLPIIDLYVGDKGRGYAIGTFGSVHVTEDGGRTWVPGYEYVENQRSLNLNRVTAIGDVLYIVGEGGLVYQWDIQKDKFSALKTGYEGSFYGLIGDALNLYAFGLRGTLYHSADAGLNWNSIETGTSGLLMDGLPVPGKPGHFLLFAYDGHVYELGNGGLHKIEVQHPIAYIGAAAVTDNLIATVGKEGVQLLAYRDGAIQTVGTGYE